MTRRNSAPGIAPRKVRHGIRLRSSDEQLVQHWPAGAWLQAMNDWIEPDVLADGWQFARDGQTISLDIHPGRIEAVVQDIAAKPFNTIVTCRRLSDEQWQQLIEAMAGEAIYGAKMLAGELPEQITALAAVIGVSLIPRSAGAFQAKCTCAQPRVCRHVATACVLMAEQLIEKPLLLFLLRGLHVEQVLERLRQRRAVDSRGITTAHAAFHPSQSAPMPLELTIEHFWHTGPGLSKLDQLPPAAHVPHALLRRLGPSPLNGRFPMSGLLASVYDVVTDAAKRLSEDSDGYSERPESDVDDRV